MGNKNYFHTLYESSLYDISLYSHSSRSCRHLLASIIRIHEIIICKSKTIFIRNYTCQPSNNVYTYQRNIRNAQSRKDVHCVKQEPWTVYSGKGRLSHNKLVWSTNQRTDQFTLIHSPVIASLNAADCLKRRKGDWSQIVIKTIRNYASHYLSTRWQFPVYFVVVLLAVT